MFRLKYKQVHMEYRFTMRMNELETKLKETESRLDCIETQFNCSSSESDTIDLIEEEIHWIVKIFHRFFCYH